MHKIEMIVLFIFFFSPKKNVNRSSSELLSYQQLTTTYASPKKACKLYYHIRQLIETHTHYAVTFNNKKNLLITKKQLALFTQQSAGFLFVEHTLLQPVVEHLAGLALQPGDGVLVASNKYGAIGCMGQIFDTGIGTNNFRRTVDGKFDHIRIRSYTAVVFDTLQVIDIRNKTWMVTTESLIVGSVQALEFSITTGWR